MDLVAENGCSVSIPSGCKRKLGRGLELAIFDKTVSRDQVLVESKEQRKKASSGDPDTCVLFIKVLGSNPVCILHEGQSTRGRSGSQEVVFLKKGEKDTLFLGDKFSLSLSHPMFFTVREGDEKKGSPNLNTINKLGSIAQDELLQKRKDGKNMTEAGPSNSHVAALSDAGLPEVRDNVPDEEVGVAQAVAQRQKRALEGQQQQANMLQGERVKEAEDMSDVQPEDRDNATNEEVGIAQAVARRQKRALERRQQQAHMLPGGQAREVEDISDAQQGAHEADDVVIKTENIDPVKDFGFLVEGSEFDQYKNRCQSVGGRWIWPPPTSSAKSPRDDDIEDRHTKKRGRKKTREEDDDEWGGDDQEEEVAIASATKRKVGAKLNLRSHEPSTSKNRDVSIKSKKPGGRTVKNREEEEEEDEDEADETLGGFIVNNDEEDPIDDGDDADDEEEESSEDEEIEEADEDEDMEETPKTSTKKREEKPLCKYGKNCYRKNADHLAQFRHQ